MSWSSVFSWALSTVESQAKKAAISEVQQAATALSNKVQEHAPDMQQAIQSSLQAIAAQAIAGIATRKL